jgi:hypothetical protein
MLNIPRTNYDNIGGFSVLHNRLFILQHLHALGDIACDIELFALYTG